MIHIPEEHPQNMKILSDKEVKPTRDSLQIPRNEKRHSKKTSQFSSLSSLAKIVRETTSLPGEVEMGLEFEIDDDDNIIRVGFAGETTLMNMRGEVEIVKKIEV